MVRAASVDQTPLALEDNQIMLVARARLATRFPIERLPRLAVDTHFHVFGPAASYPYASDRGYTPAVSSLKDYERLARLMGIQRAVIVQPSPYGFDNRRTLSVMKESHLDLRAVVVLGPETSDQELAALHAQGVRGVRLNLLFNAGLPLEAANRLADRIRPLGWHLQILADVSEIDELATLITGLKIPVVFDHNGHVPTAKGIQSAGFQTLLALVRDSLAWVKLSGSYRSTKSAMLPYDDVRPFQDALLNANPAQLLWGTDWPHPSIPVPMPDDIDLLDDFNGWLSDTSLRQMIFVDTPTHFYGFEQ